MLDIKFIRENPNKVKQGCKKKQVKVDIDKLLALDRQKNEQLKEIENLRARQNKLGKDDIKEAQEVKAKIKKVEPELERIKKEFQSLMLQVPNLPLDGTPTGKDENDNIILREVGEKSKFVFQPKDYLEIAEKLDWIDIKRAAKISGSRFGFLKNQAALLEFVLVNFTLNVLMQHGFSPIIPPVMLKPEMMKAMGYIKESQILNLKSQKWISEEMYFLKDDDLVLVGTSEQSIGPMYADEILNEKDLPKRYVGFSSCFRREAGAYGKDTRGILRVHQFDKLEMFSFCYPEKSKEEHGFLLSMEEKLMQLLKIPYRVAQMCTGDLGDPAASKYDIEAWMPGQNQYRETHSTSNCTDFQARRLNIRYRKKGGELNFVHTLNGTAFAIGRILIAIIENYQQKDGSVKIPEVLQKYMVGEPKII